MLDKNWLLKSRHLHKNTKNTSSSSSSSSSSSLGPVANATHVLQPGWLMYLPYPPAFLDVLTFAARYPHVPNDARDPSSERWNCVGEN